MPSQERISEAVRQEAARWITERDAGPLTQDDEAELARWLDADPSHRHAYARLETLWEEMGSAPVEAALHHPADILPFPVPVTRRRWMGGAIAASLALVFIGAANDWPTRLRADAVTATGEQREIRLADGSTLKLNSGSAVAIHYGTHARVIDLLKGEAAFTVAADRSRPFTVNAGSGSTTALGTRFTVRQEGSFTDVTVTEHSVRVAGTLSGGAPAPAVIVHEGQVTRYGADGPIRPRNVDTDMATAWMRGNLVFVDRPLDEVVADLNRYHSGYIHVLGSTLAGRRFSGVLPITDPMVALDTIEQSLGIESTRITDRLIFLHD